MINYTLIEDTLTGIARDAVGKYLSILNVKGTPSVIVVRPNHVKPDYPYITLSRIDTRDTYGWRRNDVVNEDCTSTISTHKTIQFQFTVYGSDTCTGATAHDIANELEGFFRLEEVMNKLNNDSGASLDQTFPVTDASQITNASEQLEAAFFTFTVNTVDELNYSPGVFDTVCIEGSVYPIGSDNELTFTSEINSDPD